MDLSSIATGANKAPAGTASASANAATKTSKAPGPGGLKETPKEAFLNLLVAQLEHQNPLSPVENTEFTAQLAQFTSLEQLQAMNTNLTALMSAQSAANGLQAAVLIGKQVQAQGNSTHISTDGQVAPLHYTLGGASTKVEITIADKAGNNVRTLKPGTQKAGTQEVKWDGKNDQGSALPEGAYRYTVNAEDKDGRTVSVNTSLNGIVDSVTYVDKNPYLVVGGTQVGLDDITQVTQTK